MGVDHQDDPAAGDRASPDREDGPAFDVWAIHDRQSGPASPGQDFDAAEDEPAPPVALTGHEDDAPVPSQALDDHEGGDPSPHAPGSGDAGDRPALPVRAPSANEDGQRLSRWATPAAEAVTDLPRRVPRGQDDSPGLPRRGSTGPGDRPPLPTRDATAPGDRPPLPTRDATTPGDRPPLPTRDATTPGDRPPLPTRDATTPGDGPPLPTRSSTVLGDGSVLPVRTSRYRRVGRHSSPHQLSLPSDTPALVIAVPGAAMPENEEIATRIADIAGSSCPGAEVRVGYLRGSKDHLEEVLDGLDGAGGPPGVVVPLLSFPNAEADAAIADVVAAARAPFLTAAHLGPHPLLAEALHARLADAGLARAARVGRISIVTGAGGIIVGAAGEDDAIEGAGVVAVLLASRLTMPVAAASLADPASIKDAAHRLHEAGVSRVALAPCMVGPELTSGTLDAIAALTSTEYAPPLGSHPAIAQLVAIRYGAALADPKVATLMAEARGEPMPASPLAAPVPPTGAAP